MTMQPIGVTVIVAAFHAGAYRERVGNGPHFLLNNQLVDHLRDEDVDNRDIEVVEIGRVDAFEGEIGRSFEVKRRIAAAVKNAIEHNRFPLVLAGNCNATVGVYAGLPDKPTDVVWFDAHPDFNTPDEVTGGYFDGMGVATLVGQAWKNLAHSIPGFRPLGLDRLTYCGIRDFEPGQREKVEASGISAVYGNQQGRFDHDEHNYGRQLGTLLDIDDRNGDSVVIHLDLDVLDTSVGHANEYAAPGGLSEAELANCLRAVMQHRKPIAMTIASFNPNMPHLWNADASIFSKELDPDAQRIAKAGIQAAVLIVSTILRRS
jgi:arginase